MRVPRGLLVESEAWQRDGLITVEQRRAILARYQSQATAVQQASSMLTWLAVIVGGIGAIVLVAWNWTAIPDVVKVLATAAPMVGLYAASAMAARAHNDVYAERFALAAALFAGGVIFVTDDVFHVDPQRTGAMMLWGVVLAATAVLTPSAIVAAVGTAVTAWWMLTTGGMPPAPWWFLAIWPMLALAVERAPNRWVGGGVTLIFGVGVFFLMLGVWSDHPVIPAIGAVLAGCWLDTLAHAPDERRPAFARVTPALVITLLGLLLLLPSGTHQRMTDWRRASDAVLPAFALLAALAAGTGWNLWRRGAWLSRPAGLTALAVLWLAVWLILPGQLRANTTLQWTWTAAFSAALVLMGAGALHDAARTRDFGLLVVGLSSLVFFVILRVVDARSLVVSGVMLIASAGLLWWLARLWARPAPAGVAP